MMVTMSAYVLRNLQDSQVQIQLEDGTMTTAISTVWVPPGSIVMVRLEAGKVWRVAGR